MSRALVLAAVLSMSCGGAPLRTMPAEAPSIGHGRTGPYDPPIGLPLPQVFELRVEKTGCLALKDPASTGAVESPSRLGALHLTPTPGGLLMYHLANHRCCQTFEVEAKVEASHVTLTESFSGGACECACSSELRFSLGLTSGTYEVVVLGIEDGGPPLPLHTQSVTVPGI